MAVDVAVSVAVTVDEVNDVEVEKSVDVNDVTDVAVVLNVTG